MNEEWGMSNEQWALSITSVSKPLFDNMLFTTVYLLAFSRHQQLQRILVWINMWLWRQYCFFCDKYFIMRKYEQRRLLELSQVLKSSIQIACYSLRIYYSLAFVMRMRMFWLFFWLCVTERKKKTRELSFESSVWFGTPDKSIHIKYHKSMDSKENQITYSCLTRAKATKQIHIGMNGTCCHVLLKYFHCNQVCFLWFPLATNSRQQHPFLANQCEVGGKISMNTEHTHTHHGWKLFLFSNRIRLSNRFHFVGFIQFPSLIAFRFSRTLWLKYQENKYHFKSNLEFFRYFFSFAT